MNISIAPFESEAHYCRLRQKLVAYFNYRRCSDPEDLADETVTRLIASYPCKGGVPGVDRWAYGIARRVYLEWLRDPGRQSEPLDGCEADEVLTPGAERFRLVARVLIGNLDSLSRDLLEERFIDGTRVRILAARRGVTPEGIRSRIFRLRQNLCHQFTSETAR